jgi:hypothetical protein
VIEIRALRELDNRASFRSGDADLDRFFQQFAGQNQFRHHLGVWAPPQENDEKGGFTWRSSRRIQPIHPQPAHRYRQRRTIGSKTASGRSGARLKRLAPHTGHACTFFMFNHH